MNIGLLSLNPTSFSLTFRKSLFTGMTWLQSFLPEDLTIILSLPFVRRWHTSTSAQGISQPTLLNISSTLDSRSSFGTSRGMPTTSKHSLLEYWVFSQECLFTSAVSLLRNVLTVLTILISDSGLTKFLWNLWIFSRASVFALLNVLTLRWSDKVISLPSFFWQFLQCSLRVYCHYSEFSCRSRLQ